MHFAGTAQMDGAILVVAATDGTMPQTREHLLLAKQIGITHLVVFINKADVADKEMIELVEIEVRELLTEFGFDGLNVPVVVGSALCALENRNPEVGVSKVQELLDAVDGYVPTPVRDLDKPFKMPIDSIFSIVGRGTVVTGKLLHGVIKKGLECEIVGHDKYFKSTITGIEMFKKQLERAEAGDQLGALVRGMKRDELRRGMVLAKTGMLGMHNHFEAQVYLLSKEEGGSPFPCSDYTQVQMFCTTWDAPALLETPDKAMVMPGEDAKIIINLHKKMVVHDGSRFTLRAGSRTKGYGVITKILPLRDAMELDKARKKAKKLRALEKEQSGY